MKKQSIWALLALSCLMASIGGVEAKCWENLYYGCGGAGFYGDTDWFYNFNQVPSYNVVFNNESAYDSQMKTYMVCPNTLLKINNISAFTYSCGNGYTHYEPGILVSWVYGNSKQIKMDYNNKGPSSDTLRTEVIPENMNKEACMYSKSPAQNLINVYQFTDPSKNYTVYIDTAECYCSTSPLYLACWSALRNFNVMIVNNASVKIAAPQPVNTSRGSSVPLAWTITNTGKNIETISISKDCGGFSCAFVGYTDNHVLTLSAGQSYTAILTVFVSPSATCGNVGITVTYDDGYGFSCIQPKTMSSYVPISLNGGCTGTTTSSTTTTTTSTTTTSSSTTSTTTTTTTTTTSSSTTSTTSTTTTTTSITTSSTSSGSTTSTSSTSSTTTTLYTRSVTLKYNVTDDHATKLNCSLWTNISGTWKIEKTYTNINKLEAQYFRINNVSEGTYAWTANCTDGVNTPSSYPYNAYQTSATIPGMKYWTFNVKAT